MECTVIIPCLNEERFIGPCLNSIIAQDYPKTDLEVLIVDGMSSDNTAAIVQNFAQQYPFVKLLNNPARTTPCALNMGIKAARGNHIIRMDAHAAYENDYVSKCIRYLNEYKADNVGGTMITLPRENTFIARLMVYVLTSRFGVGNSDFRTGVAKTKETDTVFCGCYPRRVFREVGLFNEKLKRGQDMEFNLRLKKNGGKILLVPEIKCYYYPQTDSRSFLKNNFKNGLWAIKPFLYTEFMPVSLRHLVPMFFLSGLLLGLLAWIFLDDHRMISGLMLAYTACAAFFAAGTALRRKDLRYFFCMPAAFFCLHASYGAGSLAGLAFCLPRPKFWVNLCHIARKIGKNKLDCSGV